LYVQESKDRSALAQQVTSLLEMKSAARRGGEGPDAGAEGLRENTGDWGEGGAERILEAAGLRRDHEYTMQETIAREEASRARPDVILHLPGNPSWWWMPSVTADYGTYSASADEALRKHACHTPLCVAA